MELRLTTSWVVKQFKDLENFIYFRFYTPSLLEIFWNLRYFNVTNMTEIYMKFRILNTVDVLSWLWGPLLRERILNFLRI